MSGIIIILLLFIVACRPEHIRYPHCWHCEVAAQSRRLDTCTEKEEIPVFIDADGNAVDANCVKK